MAGGMDGIFSLAVLMSLLLVTAQQQEARVAVMTLQPHSEAASVLGALCVAALQAAGRPARLVNPPVACVAPDHPGCLQAALRGLARGDLTVAIVPVGAAAPPHSLRLRDAGLQELGDAAPPSRRACFAPVPPVRSLLDLQDPAISTQYAVAISSLPTTSNHTCFEIGPAGEGPEPCTSYNSLSATILVEDDHEARTLTHTLKALRLPARVVSAGPDPLWTAKQLHPSALACKRDPDLADEQSAIELGPPPCHHPPCPFELHRIIKLVNARDLVSTPAALRVIGRIAVNATELHELKMVARNKGVEQAARDLLAARPQWTAGHELRVAVMLPATTTRHVQNAASLAAAAQLAEDDGSRDHLRFKVELIDDGCAATEAFKYLTDAPGAEFGALAGVVGPACGAAFTDVARQTPALSMPVIAYTPQAPPPAPGDELTILAAGDARLYADVWAIVLAEMGWRRIAVLSELATRSTLQVTRLRVSVVVHEEVAGEEELSGAVAVRWATRAAAADARILLLAVEDARLVRAALCAGRAAGLTPATGCVFLMPGWLPANWLTPMPTDDHNCTQKELEETAASHLSVAPEWLVLWEEEPNQKAIEWELRLHGRCAECNRAPPAAALLYDALQMWSGALRTVGKRSPATLHRLHEPQALQAVIEEATRHTYSGLTGELRWERVGMARARSSAVIVQQWNAGSQHIARWESGVLKMGPSPLQWATPDGRTPNDGEQCALRSLAGGDCRAAALLLAALVLAGASTALAAAALLWRRRATNGRDKLDELAKRKPSSLDRWEVPRDRLVINRKLGTGAFGTVYGGHASLREQRGWTAVAVKTLKPGASIEEKLDFLSEAETMKRFDHENIVKLLGVVTHTEPVCTVMEFLLYGDLKGYLLARRHLAGSTENAEEVSPVRLTRMALDVARALVYLTGLRYVHRDVAARNCLVSATRVVKLADFGMTRLVFENDYYRFSRKGLLPVRWMAPESLALGVFSSASDVWSFGVLLYEIVTFGSLPFQGLSNAEVLARVKSGRNLDLPPGLQPQLEQLIKSCWRRDHRQRPPASELAGLLAESSRLLTPCLDMPLDALPLDDGPWRAVRRASWGAPSASTDTTDLSAEGPRDTDCFLR